MVSNGPKTAKGKRNKMVTGDGRKNPTVENMFSPPKGKKKNSMW